MADIPTGEQVVTLTPLSTTPQTLYPKCATFVNALF